MATATTTIVYASLGPELKVFALDAASGALTPLQTLLAPASVQYAWPNRARTRFYVALSQTGPAAKDPRPDHFVETYDILADGRLARTGPTVRLNHRPIFITLDGA